MASINKLAIRGVRSFSPVDDEQVISFCFPLTIIVGENGCGKTTIIESLKYAVTGSLPPGNKSGHSFIHDPKSVGQSTVKGQIKLRFTNRAGKNMVVIRSMEVTQKKTTMSFKALDGILRTTHPETGERVSLSHKCTELDRQIPALLGVSKAILDHVVFCHQEESSWPLMDGATLKKRFDDIFDSTRYTKALEQITKTRKDLASTAKDLKADLSALASHKHAASLTREELESNQEKMEEIEQDITSFDERIQEQMQQLQELEESERQMEEAKEELQHHQNLIQEQETVAKSIQDLLENDYTDKHTESQLKKMLCSFDHQGEKAEQDLREKEDECNDITADIEDLTNKLINEKATKAKLEGEKETHEEDIQKRLQLLLSIAQKHNIPIPKGSLSSSMVNNGSIIASTSTSTSADLILDGTQATTDSQLSQSIKMLSLEQIDSFISSLNDKQTQLNNELDKLRQVHQKNDDQLQTQLSSLEGKQQALKNDLSRIQSEQFNMEQELQQLNSMGPSHSRIRKSDLEAAHAHAKQAAKDYKDLSEHPKFQSIPLQLKEYDENLHSLQRLIEEDNYTLTELRRFSQDQNTIQMLQQQVQQDLERLEESCADNSFIMQKYNVKVDMKELNTFESMAESIRDKYESIKREFDQANLDSHRKQQRVTEKQTLLEHTKLNQHSKQAKLTHLNTNSTGGVKRMARVINGVRRFETEEFGACPLQENSTPIEIIQHLERQVKQFQEDDEHSIRRSTQKIKKLFQNRMKETKIIACPCCTREMDTDETSIFLREMDRLDEAIVALDKEKSKQNQTTKEQYEKWKGMVNTSTQDWQEGKRLKKEIEDMEQIIEQGKLDLVQLQSDLDDVNNHKSSLETESTELHNFYTETGRLQDDALRILDKQSQIKSKEERIAMMAPNSGGRDLNQVETDVNTRLEEKESIMKSIASLNKEMSTLNKRIQMASTQVSSAEQAVRDKEAKYKKDEENANRKLSLKESVSNLREKEEKLHEKVLPLKRQVNALVNEKERARSLAKTEERNLTQTIKSFSSHMQTISSFSARINDFVNEKKLSKLDKIVEKLKTLDSQIAQKKSIFEGFSKELEVLKNRMAEQERYKKSLQDNLHLIETRKKVDALKEEYVTLETQFNEMANDNPTDDDYATLVKKKNRLLSEKARREGRIGELQYQQKMLKKKLQTKEYKDVDERHRVKMIEYETTNIMVSDLEVYHKALDKALLRYHGIKIEDINKIIRELWTLTYQGEDIHNIKLVSGQDKGSRASRSYNYRVVMTKGNTEMDMRGRCSAGQRILASIVIRLALAETFCLNCGVLALDEPTTNLDYENKRGLAIALAQIIANRAAQRNFQLVIITHDEDFVTMMKNQLATQTGFPMPENYFHVSRQEGRDGLYYSRINAISWDDL